MSLIEVNSEANAIIKYSRSLRLKVGGFLRMLRKTGEDDPRRIIHSLKVGLAITLVSTFYYINPLFKTFGDSAIWAVLTVVLVMEFTVGGVISKGLNRTCGTFIAGALGIAVHLVAKLCGEKGEPVVLATFVFLIAIAATFARYIPELKARHDYGMMIIILTFCMVTVSSFRDDNIIVMAQERLTTIGIGVAIAFFTSTLVCPFWAGDDLHRLEAANLEKLANYLQALGNEYFREKRDKSSESKPILQSYKSVLNSKPIEDNLANLARWEPCHGQFGFRHPWDQYLKVGTQSRRCAHLIVALDACITKIEFKVNIESELHKKIHEACTELSLETSKALTELASTIRTMKAQTTANQHIAVAALAAEQLKKSFFDSSAVKEIPYAASIITLLLEIFECSQQTLASVEELARLSHFRSSEVVNKSVITPVNESPPHVAIELVE